MMEDILIISLYFKEMDPQLISFMTCLFYFWKPFLLARNKILFNQALTDFGLKILSGIILNTGPISAVKLSVFTLGRTITFVFGSITLLIPPPPPVSEGLSH